MNENREPRTENRRPTTDNGPSSIVHRPSSIVLHIDELILQGFAPRDRAIIAAAVQRELGRILAERGAPPGWAEGIDVARLDGGSFDMAPGMGADAVGAQVAQAIYGSMGAQGTSESSYGNV